jgi:hypothetical protein
MLLRYEKDRDLIIKYRMNLNRHWYDWQNLDPDFENYAQLILSYQILTSENVLTEERITNIKAMWGFERETQTYNIPTEGGFKKVEAARDRSTSGMIRNYWLGRYYGLIDPEW